MMKESGVSLLIASVRYAMMAKLSAGLLLETSSPASETLHLGCDGLSSAPCAMSTLTKVTAIPYNVMMRCDS